MVFVVEGCGDCFLGSDAADEFERAVECAGGVEAGDDDGVVDAAEEEGFFRVRPEVGDFFVVEFEDGIVALGEENFFCAAQVSYGGAQAGGGELLAGSWVGGGDDVWSCECGKSGREEGKNKEKSVHF